MQLTEMEMFHIGEQLRAEAVAIAKCATAAQQSTDPNLQQLYSRTAERHRGHYETLLRQMQSLTGQKQF
ncbi:MAG: spore coat protein [Eubacteriales bacterium]